MGLELQPELAECHIQALLVVYHSSLAHEDLRKLNKAFARGAPLIEQNSTWQRQTLQQMQTVARRVQFRPASVGLHDVLLEWKARRSKMADWQNHAAGNDYLGRYENHPQNNIP